MKAALIIFFLLLAGLQGKSQQKPISGFIIKSLEIENNGYMDFFLEAEIDSTISVEDNFIRIKNDTLMRINLSNVDIGSTYTIRSETRLLHVVPARVIMSDWSMVDMFLHTQDFISFRIEIGARTIANGYNPRLIQSFKQFRRVKSAETEKMIIEDFVNSLADSSITNDEIRKKFLIVKKMDQADLDFINLHLSYAREELAKNKIGGDKIKIVPYGDLKEDEKLIIVSKERIRNVYLVYYNNTGTIPILLENGKIKAFATLGKGGRKYFMEY